MKHSFEMCAFCEKPGKSLKFCSSCKNTLYCDKVCQKNHWKVHKVDCKRLAEVRDDAKAAGVKANAFDFHPDFVGGSLQAYSAASGHGSINIMLSPTPQVIPHMVVCQNYDDQTPERLSFKTLDDLHPSIQFLLCCGPFNDIERAKSILPKVLKLLPDGSTIAQLRMPGAHFSALDFAARKGNIAIVEWFCADERLRCCIKAGAAIGWACYTNHVDVARLLLRHGADPAAADSVFFGSKPPLLAAAEAGRLLAMRWLVEEAGQDLRVTAPGHGDVISAIHDPFRVGGVMPPGNQACLDWVRARGIRG